MERLLTECLILLKYLTDDKEGKEPIKADFLEETFLTMCQLKRIDGMWRLDTGKGRRRDVDEAQIENVENVEVNEEKNFNKILIGNKLRKMREIRGKNKLKKKAEVRGNQERKGLRWNIRDHGVDPSGHLQDY
ncbi:hypothetical protein Dimus_029269, partial [Dionaea muscipula]